MNRFAREKRPDLLLLIATLLLVSIGTVMIYSASSILAMERFRDGNFFLKKQIFFVFLGLLLMILVSRIPYYQLRRLAWPGIVISLILLAALWIPGLGIRAGGALRWLKIGGFSFQVSELAKMALIVFLASYLTHKAGRLREFSQAFLIPLAVTGVLAAAIVVQPDFGTSVLVVAVALLMIYLAGGRILHLAGIGLLIAPFLAWLLVHKSYRLARLMTFLDPWKDPRHLGFHIIQSLVSFGSGGALGVGIGDGIQKLFYLPEPHTDFILSVIAEEGGFLAVAFVLFLYIILIVRGFMISLKAPDLFGHLLAAGLTTLIALETFVNIAGVMGLIPLKGLALPLLSYGGTSLMMTLVAVGMLLNISSYEG